jgi:DNA-binding NtrC family response regulator
MRPRKKVLIVGECEDRVSILAFALGLTTYHVTTSSSAAAALDLMRERAFELLLVDLPLAGAERLCDFAAAIEVKTPSVLVGARSDFDNSEVVADARVVPQRDRAELLERIKIITARKRGPKKGSERKPCASESTPEVISARCAS